MVLFFSLISFVTGCSYKQTFYFIDENGMPVKDVLVAAEEFEMFCLFTNNRIMINKTDGKGRIVFYVCDATAYYAGKIGYYPVSFRGSGDIFSFLIYPDPLKILIRRDYGHGYPYTEYERVIFEKKEIKTVVESPLWNDWKSYLQWLEKEDYFKP
ncbi:MAG: hypothetical protein A2017_00385 [Lentisphaerae bacterium GWF2_44_16]|nr:MAG: hypothetical protein A2017_00385 [Lentisphaerae bacterium GWF2_44_16]